MSLYARPGTNLWQYTFVVAGKRYRGSTKTANQKEAEDFERSARQRVEDREREAQASAALSFGSQHVIDVASSWLRYSAANLQDHRNNLTRVRKLFGRAMCLDGATWRETESGRFGLTSQTRICDLTPALLTQLAEARYREGASAGTVNRELSLVQSLLRHARTTQAHFPAQQGSHTKERPPCLPLYPTPPTSCASASAPG